MGWVVSVTPRPHFNPGESTSGTHWIGGWVGPRAGLDSWARRKILCPCRASNPDRHARSKIVRHYTAWATAVIGAWGSGGISPRILNLSIIGKWMVIFSPRPLHHEGRTSVPIGWLGGPESRSGRSSIREKSLAPALSCSQYTRGSQPMCREGPRGVSRN
jgi:hypothetical protein